MHQLNQRRGRPSISLWASGMLAAIAVAIVQPVRAQFGVPISATIPLNTNAATDSGADSAPFIIHANGIWLCVWHSSEAIGNIGTDTDIFIARSTDGGTTWTAPAVLNSTASEDGIARDEVPRLATNGQGMWVCAWMSTNTMSGTLGIDQDLFFARSIDNGLTWSSPLPLNTNAAVDSEHDNDVALVTDGAGVWVAAWRSLQDLNGNGRDGDLFFARSVNDGQTWSPPALLNSTALGDTAIDMKVQIACDAAGVWIAVWQSNNSLNGTIGTDYDIFITRSVNHGVTWSPAAPLNSNAASDSGLDHDPQIATDRSGMWIVTWASTDTLGGTIGNDEDVLVVRSIDNGVTWSAPMPLHPSMASDTATDLLPRIACGLDDRWVVAWHSNNSLDGTIGSDNDILISQSSDAGATWTAPAALNSTAADDTGLDEAPFVANDHAGAWLAVWQSRETMSGTLGLDLDVFTARFALPDCNQNMIADSTEPDANQNGIPDDCEQPGQCPADVTTDGLVNVSDLLVIISAWGPCPAPPQTCPADITADNVVNVSDLLAVISAWGPCP